MSLKQAIVIAVALVISYAGGVVMGKTETERFELEGNMKFFGVGSGIIFTDGTKQTSAGVGSSNDVTCASTCVGFGEIAAGAVGSAEVVDDSLTASDLGPDSVTASEIAAGAVGTSEVASDSLTANDLANDSVTAFELAADAVGTSEVDNDSLTASDLAANSVGTSEVSNNSLTSDDLASSSVDSSEIATDAVGASEIATGAVGSSELASNAVTSSKVEDKSLQLNDLAMTVVMNQTIDLFNTTLDHGECSGFTATLATGAPSGSFALPFGVKLASNGTNPGWTMEGENSPTNAVDSVKVRVCNQTGGTAEAPNLRFNFWSIAQ